MQSPFFYFTNFRIFLSVLLLKIYWIIPTKLYLKWMFRLNVGYTPNLESPRSFNEKLNWLKLNDRNPDYTKMVDKLLVKEYVASVIGDQYIIPTLGVWTTGEGIEWNKLPDQFVLKTTHGSGGSSVVICKDKRSLDKARVIKLLNDSLHKSNTFAHYKEWPYKNVAKKIIAEKYISDGDFAPKDYKIHNFNGIPKFILVCRNRYSNYEMVEDFYTIDWKLMELSRPGKPHVGGVERPKELERMLELAKVLSKNIPFVRTDFYVVNGKIYFGELTFYPASGLVPFIPQEMDFEMGSWLKLPSK